MKRHLIDVSLLSAFIAGAAHAAVCDLNATPSNFAAQVAATAPGQTLCLASGNYGDWQGVTKTSPGIRITPAAGANVTLGISFKATPTAAWITIDGVTMPGGIISGPSHHITVKNCTITDQMAIETTGPNNWCGNCVPMNSSSAIVFEGNTFNLANVIPPASGGWGGEGRLQIVGNGTAGTEPADVTIRNNVFRDNCADGIQMGGGGLKGVTIGPGNEFVNLYQFINGNGVQCSGHIDGIQVQGTSKPGPTITGNYFHDSSDGIVFYDWDSDVIVTHNVFARLDGPYLMCPHSGLCAHNTVVGGEIVCGYNHQLDVCRSDIRNNIGDFISAGGTCNINGNESQSCMQSSLFGNAPVFSDYNLCKDRDCAITSNWGGQATGPSGKIPAGTHSLQGTVQFVGGANPTTYAGFALASNSLGRNAASDGKDMGIVLSADASAPSPPSGLAVQ